VTWDEIWGSTPIPHFDEAPIMHIMLSCGFGKRGLSLRRSRSSGVEDRDHSLLGEQLEELVGPGRRDAPVPGTAFASPGAPAAPGNQASPATPAGPSSQRSAFLTAATVKRVASASRSALANSGREQISYRSLKNGTVTTAGTDTVTYSGSNYNYAVHQTVPAFPDGVARVVHGQYYLKGDPRQQWLHQLGADTSPQFPEVATLLRLLSPAADFQDAGTDVIGGTRLTRLHATRLSGLPEALTLARYANLTAYAKSATVPPGTLTALDVWVDSHNVVHQMRIQLLGSDGQTTLTVTFSDSGQPQSITAPATSNPIPASS
jgi:hypothetical protein